MSAQVEETEIELTDYEEWLSKRVEITGGITIGAQIDRLLSYLVHLAETDEQREELVRYWKMRMAATSFASDSIEAAAFAATEFFKDPRAR